MCIRDRVNALLIAGHGVLEQLFLLLAKLRLFHRDHDLSAGVDFLFRQQALRQLRLIHAKGYLGNVLILVNDDIRGLRLLRLRGDYLYGILFLEYGGVAGVFRQGQGNLIGAFFQLTAEEIGRNQGCLLYTSRCV